MRRLFLFSLIALTLAAGCNALDMTDDNPQTKTEASKYVDELMQSFRDGTAGSIYCPDVRWAHIPALLEYGKSTEIIGDGAHAIPANPISSHLMLECSEGIFALWMVEAARLHTLKPRASGIDGWPSQNPIIQRLNEGRIPPTWYVNDTAVQQEVLDAYVAWWKAAKGKKSAASKDPLEGTGYMWH